MAYLSDTEMRIVRAHSVLVVRNIRPTIQAIAAFVDLDVEMVGLHIAKLHTLGQLANEPTLAPVTS